MNRIVPATVAALPWSTLAVVAALAGVGAVVLYSAAGGSFAPWAGMHLVRFAVLLVMALVMRALPEDFYRGLAFPAYGATVLLLVLVEVIGGIRGGSQRWLDLGVIQLQPSELMKPVIVLACARFYDLLPMGQVRSWSGAWPLLLLVGVPAALILVQPDLGTTIAVVVGALTVAFLAGLPLRLFIGGAAAFALLAPLAYFFALEEYQQRRVTTFLDPESDPLGAGYHISQSKIAIGSGGLFGKGFLNGTQSHLDYLPEGHTDFVFATMVEEWGVAGGLVLLLLYALLLRFGFRTAINARSRFARLAAAGMTMTIFVYIAVNLLMVLGFAPVVGIPLPLVSHGGSSMLTIMICVGVLLAIDRQRRPTSAF